MGGGQWEKEKCFKAKIVNLHTVGIIFLCGICASTGEPSVRNMWDNASVVACVIPVWQHVNKFCANRP